MPSVLDQPDFLGRRVSRLTVEDYHRLCESNASAIGTELIRGIVIEKMSKSPLHGGFASILQDFLTPQIRQGWLLRREEPLTFRDSEPEPDIAIVEGKRLDYLHVHPTTAALAVEVAVTTLSGDRAMVEIYAEAGVGEHWILRPREKLIEVYRQPENSRYREVRVYGRTEEVVCSTVPGLQISLAKLFESLP